MPAPPLANAPAWARRLPHALSFARVVLTFLTYVAAWQHDKGMFAVLVLLAVVTDVLDGPLARAMGTASKFGANVDSAADMLFYVSLPIWAALFDPRIVGDNLVLILSFLVLYITANFASHYVFGALGVHNRLSRASGTAGVAFTFYSILWGVHPLLLNVLLLVLVADLAQRYGAVFGYLFRKKRAAAQR